MHKLRSPGGRRGIGVHVVRVAAFSAALLAITGIVVADVFAAEPEEAAIGLAEGASAGAGVDERGPVLLAAAVIVPEGVAPLAASLPEVEEPEPPVKKKRSSKLKFGRFEGY